MVRTASASSGPPRIRQAWRDAASRKSFWPLVPAVLLFNVGVAIFLFLYNLFMLHLGYAERSLGLLAGMLAFGSMAGTIPIGLLAQRLGTRKVLVGSLLA